MFEQSKSCAVRLFGGLMLAAVSGVGFLWAASDLLLFQEALQKFKSGQYRIAADLFEEGLKSEPDSALAHYYLGQSWEKTGRDIEDAIKEYEKAYELDPNSEPGVKAFARTREIAAIARRRIDRIKAYLKHFYDNDYFGTSTLKIYGASSGNYQGSFHYRHCISLSKYSYRLRRQSGDFVDQTFRVRIWTYASRGRYDGDYELQKDGARDFEARAKWEGDQLRLTIADHSSEGARNLYFPYVRFTGDEDGVNVYSSIDKFRLAKSSECKGKTPK